MSKEGEVLQKQIVLTLLGADDPFLKGLRWSELRDHILSFKSGINGSGVQAFNMRMTRAMKQLIKKGIIYKDNQGHKQIYYKIIENSLRDKLKEIVPKISKDENLFQFIVEKKYGKALNSTGRLFVHYLSNSPGILLLSPLEEYEVFKSRFMEKATEVMQPHIREMWEGLQKLRV